MRRAALSRIRRIVLAALLVPMPAFAGAAKPRADPPPSTADWQRIRLVITARRDALIAGDGERAAALATGPVRRQFRDGTTFLRMIRESYAPLLEARYTEFLEGAVIDGTVVQPLRLVLPDDTVMVALFAVDRQRDGRWRIAGCLIAPSTVSST